MTDEMKMFLKKLAARKCWRDNDDFITVGYTGGDEDAFDDGQDDGEALLARRLLGMIGEVVPNEQTNAAHTAA